MLSSPISLHKKIIIRNLCKKYPTTKGFNTVLNNFHLEVDDGEIITILGRSGCGKTTLLNILSNIEKSFEGDIFIDGKPLNIDHNNNLILVFQENALFPWLDVLNNVEFGLKTKRYYDKNERRKIALKYIDMMGLTDYIRSPVYRLSGGMKQRINLARALATDSDILLMDEPFAALDVVTKRSLQTQLIEIHQNTKKTILFVTHDVEEAVLLGHRVILLSPNGGAHKEYKVDAVGNIKQNNDLIRQIYSQINMSYA